MKLLSKFTTQILYVKIRENLLTIKSVKNGEIITLKAVTPFSTKRFLVAEFSIAQKLLQSALEKLNKGFIKPIVVVHPLENIEDRLSEVEEKIFKELALSAGAREVKLHIGRELSSEELLHI
jgi:actin-like ATPase involved in cell morphogenesis